MPLRVSKRVMGVEGTRAHKAQDLEEKLQGGNSVPKGHGVESVVVGAGLVIAPANSEEEAQSQDKKGKELGVGEDERVTGGRC